MHRVTVEYFQGNGETSLEVEIEGRGLGRQPLGPLVAATEADLDRKVEPTTVKNDDFADRAAGTGGEGESAVRVGRVRELPPDERGQEALVSTAKAPELRALKPAGGCLAETPAAGLPKYALDQAQRKALAAAIAKPPAAVTEPAAAIARTMLTFNCYACHSRDKVGGPTRDRPTRSS